MPENQEEDTRKILLSLLVARQGLTPIPVLERDYYEIEQKRVPYRKLGYATLLEYLQSMPEYFMIQQHNGNHCVRGIASEKSVHVSLLVARQREKNTRPNNRPKYPPRLRPSTFHGPYVPHMRAQPIRVSSENLFRLVEYIRNSPNGVSLADAASFIQRQVPFVNISQYDLRTQLQEITHQVVIDGYMLYPNNNVQSDVAQHQPLMDKPSPLRDASPLTNSGSPLTIQNTYPGGDEEYGWVEYYSDENDFVPVASTINADNSQRRASTSELLTTNLAQYDILNCERDMEISENHYSMMNTNSNTEEKYDRFQNIAEMVNDRTKARLEQLLQKHPEGIWCADLPNLFLKEYNVTLNYTVLGFTSVREFTSYLPKIFYMTQVSKTDDFKLYSADKRPVVPKTDPIDITQASSNQYDEQGTAQAECSNDGDDAPIPTDVSPTITKRFAPNDVMNYDDHVEKISVTELKRTRKFLEAYVVEVFNPNFFWIHLRENKKPFNRMMDELSHFYELNKDRYTIARIALKKDLNCACVYTGRWHRAIIKSVKPDFRITVFFYDYGTLKTYASEDIYYLHKRFSSLPAQGIPCGLHNIKPTVGDRWKKSVCDQFVDKIAETLLAVTIMSVDAMHNSMSIILSDTSEEEDVHINNWLVTQRLAQVGKTTDAVDMASLMKYVVNNLNQIPTYCYAEESLMVSENCWKATSSEEKHEIPSVPIVHYDNHQQQPVRPPPGFAPLDEQHVSSDSSTRSFQNSYSFANTSNTSNASNTKASVFGNTEATTNPFLDDQQSVPNDIAKQMFMLIWNENKKLQIELTNILYDLLEHSLLSFKDHIKLNKILKIIQSVLLEEKNNCSSNRVNETTLNDIGSAPYNLNSETIANQEPKVNTSSNPFDVNSGRPWNSTHDSDSYSFQSNYSQSDELSPHVQIPPTTSSVPAAFINHVPPVNTFLPKANEDSKNVPSPTPVPPVVSPSTNTCNNYSELLDNMNAQFADMLIDTNPFKFSMTDSIVPETQNEQTANNYANNYNANVASYLSTKDSPSNVFETAKIHARSNHLTPLSKRYASENYTPKSVYESGPVMYNTQQKKQAGADANARQNAYSSNFSNVQNTRPLGEKPASQISQPANDIAALHKIRNYNITKDKSQVEEDRVNRLSTYHMQNSQPIVNGELAYYQQNYNADNLRPASSQARNHVRIPEHRVNSMFQNSVPLPNQNGSHTSFGTAATFSRQNWNCNNENHPTKVVYESGPVMYNTQKKQVDADENANSGKFVSREMTEAFVSSVFKDDDDKERPMEIYNFWYSSEYGSVQNSNAASNYSPFVFQKIDLIKGVTFIFNIEQDGWILTCEFVETFTNLKLSSRLLATLEALNINVVFKEILRSEYPTQFSQLDRYPLNVPRDSEKRIISLNLISFHTALTLLHKLKIVSREELENAFKKNEFLKDSVLPVLWTLIVTYRNLKRQIEICSNYI